MTDKLLTSAARMPGSALVLGGNGFLGRHLVQTLKAGGVSVRIYDRGGHPQGYSHDVVGDFAKGERLTEALAGVEVVYHLISTTIPSTSDDDPVFDVTSNLVGTLRLLEAMNTAGVCRIVFLSSGGTVYGNPHRLPVSETVPLRPICSYGVVKASIENYLRIQAALHGVHATVLRLANPYGSGETRIGVHGVIPTFFAKVAAQEEIVIWGDGSVVRDYIHVDDAVAAMVQAAMWDGFRLYNVGSGTGHSLVQVLDIVQRVTGKKAKVSFRPGRAFDVQAIYLDIESITGETGWQPKIGLDEGCDLLWAAMQQNATGDLSTMAIKG
ncbi:NAD-dependent epimerase/dehydratase family protein [Caballeronia sp. LP003]|uniref:NAD-dependent epimerase/dehydratase family protein n=1 Tax=unclassified Caballeronia TaxID=2646786 RepID=UPI00202875A9|nr:MULTISPECIES: NAD-dependent epimerase/dehydratase family protein [unclassified Caballeronia]MDR5786614.1 NAD-dependent epimerase/dehydratase family protein [Caballeronia sp. LP003]